MVMQDGEGLEEQQLGPIEEDQALLDEVGEPTDQFATMEQYNSLMGNYQQVLAANQKLQNHVSGLESRIDRGFNSLNQNLSTLTEQAAKAEIERLEQGIRGGIEDPEEKQRMQAVLDLQRLRQPTPNAAPAIEPQPVQQQQPETAAWDQVIELVRNSGVDPNDALLDYKALVDESLTVTGRQTRFMQSLISAAQPRQQPQPESQQAPQTPTHAAGPAGTGYSSIDDVYDAYVSDRLNHEEYKKAAARFGVSV